MTVEKSPINPKTWDEFRASGLAWFVNTTLHLFGWVLVFEIDDKSGKVTSCYPARCVFRGFDEKSNDEGYAKVTKYLKENIQEIDEEVNL